MISPLGLGSARVLQEDTCLGRVTSLGHSSCLHECVCVGNRMEKGLCQTAAGMWVALGGAWCVCEGVR